MLDSVYDVIELIGTSIDSWEKAAAAAVQRRPAITRVQALNILTASELTDARDSLAKADVLVTDVRSLFFNIGNFATAARLKDIQGRLGDEIQAIERLIAAQ